MNIINRIKKLETHHGTNKPFCECFHEYRRQLINSVYDDTPFDENAVKLPEGDYCRKCRKPVDVEFERATERNIQMIYGMYENL